MSPTSRSWAMPSPFRILFCLLSSLSILITPAAAQRSLAAAALNSCQQNSAFSASLFEFAYFPENGSAPFHVVATSSVAGKVILDLSVYAYGFLLTRETVDPCNSAGLGAVMQGLCPMNAQPLNLKSRIDNIGNINAVPTIAYTFPDIDARVRILINMTDGTQAGQTVACLEAQITNGQTVDMLGVKWATAIIAFLALTSSALLSGLGYFNAASHVAVQALSLVGYFQAIAFIGLLAVPYPPLVQSWTQCFQWSLGIIHIDFMQKALRWYQRATGGTAENLMHQQGFVSVQVLKRHLETLDYGGLMKRGMEFAAKGAKSLAKRANISTGWGAYVVYGIQRAGYRAGIETTSLVITTLSFFVVLLLLTILFVAVFWGICKLCAKKGWMKQDRFTEFRNGWRVVLKGVLFRMCLIAYPAISVLCLWEFTQNDSPAIMAMAVFFLVGVTAALFWAAWKVHQLAKRSIALHRNPAYILFSDPRVLNKWGFLYIQFRATAYYFIIPIIGYMLIKSMVVAFGQGNAVAQSICFIIIEAAAVIAATVMRPWMDKSINSFNIAICVVNFINAIFVFIYVDVFDAPPMLTGIVGVIFWIMNAVFALVLLIMLIVTTAITFWQDNPDTRYQNMGDDRTSFIKSQTHLHTNLELDALGAAARGSGPLDDEDAESMSSGSLGRQKGPSNYPLPSSKASSLRDSYRSSMHDRPPRSEVAPVDPSVPFIPHGRSSSPRSMHRVQQGGYGALPHGNSPLSPVSPPHIQQPHSPGLSPTYNPPGTTGSHGGGPWNRGAGYDA